MRIYFKEHPSRGLIDRLVKFGLIHGIIIFIVFQYIYPKVYPVSAIESQLSFSGIILKAYHSTMSAQDIIIYKSFIYLDFFFVLAYGSFYFSYTLRIARKGFKSSKLIFISYLIPILGLIAAFCDVFENLFILLIFTDPLYFPDIWAIIHSWFALVKYILVLIGIFWSFIIVPILSIPKYNLRPYSRG